MLPTTQNRSNRHCETIKNINKSYYDWTIYHLCFVRCKNIVFGLQVVYVVEWLLSSEWLRLQLNSF